MTNLVYEWDVDLEDHTNTQSFKVLSSSFGDGYEQNASVGINNRSGTWQISTTGTKALIQEIKAFFDAHKGADSFLWSSPLDGEVSVKAGEYQPTELGGGYWRITTTFTQVFYP